jgi:pyridoxal/pyridoxine/pyridoxamine kinase
MENFNENISFDELLKGGEIHDALEMRLEDLEMKAGCNCAEIEAAKISSAALVITGFVLATPVTAVFAGMGAIAYLYSVASDFHQTHKFALFPLVRTGIGDLLSGVGLAATGHSNTEDADDIARAESYLSPREARLC